MNKKKVLIAGCGLAGLSTAWHLEKKGIKPYLFEKEPGIGGALPLKKCLWVYIRL